MILCKLIRVNFDKTEHILTRYMTFKIQEKNITAHQMLTYLIKPVIQLGCYELCNILTDVGTIMKEVGLIKVVCKNTNDEYPIQKQGYILPLRLLSFT